MKVWRIEIRRTTQHSYCEVNSRFHRSIAVKFGFFWLLFCPITSIVSFAPAAIVTMAGSNLTVRRSSARLSQSAATRVRSMNTDSAGFPSTPASKRPRRLSPPSVVRNFSPTDRPWTPPSVVTPTSAAGEDTETVVSNSPTRDQLGEDGFVDLEVSPQELRPSATLTTGQCFHWRAVTNTKETEASRGGKIVAKAKTPSAWGSHNATEWIGILRVPSTGDSVVVVLRETPSSVWYKTLVEPTTDESFDIRDFLYSYFQLNYQNTDRSPRSPSLRELYEEWSTQCDRLKRIAECIPGVRIVDQDPWECLVSFLCSSNNNIPRITKMLNSIRHEYGEPLCTLSPDNLGEGRMLLNQENELNVLYSFPSLEKMRAQATESDLRSKCGMGYRAKYLIKTMETLELLGGEAYLHELRSIVDPTVVQDKLLQFQGVGRKVADCVALFSLRQCDSIPVDVHVWNIARRDYGANALVHTTKSLTPTIYRKIGELFRSRFPTKSGWAHSLLFVAELPSFRPVLPDDIVEEMDKVRTCHDLRYNPYKI